MDLIINGTGRKMVTGRSLADLLVGQGLDPAAVVVELNGKIITPEKYLETLLQDRDRVEILQFVGGG